MVALGSRQSQSFTVTIDAGSEAGVGPDMTVVNNDGLVGRVLRVTRSTATVLLVIDPDSTVGGRVGSSMEIGFVTGSGSLDQKSGLDLRLVDDASVPARDDTVVTWGSTTGPYAPGVPIGTITEVYSSLREASQRAVVKPFVDFSALDVVGVMVPSGSTQRPRGDRGGREPAMKGLRLLMALAAVVVALVVQVTLFPHVAWHGIVPNLCLLVVVAAALTVEAPFALVLGFTAGLTLDLAPPADHVAGRWALALTIAAFLAARVRQDQKPTALAVVGTVAAASFVGTSLFALTGVLLQDPDMSVARPPRGRPGRRRVGRAADPVRAPAADEALRTVQPAVGRVVRGGTTARSDKSRLRLVVVQALVFSLFATLFVRLYYLQVIGGESYQAQAADQSVRDIVVQPQRGLIVDSQGRPLVANRTSWVISIDRTLLGKLE